MPTRHYCYNRVFAGCDRPSQHKESKSINFSFLDIFLQLYIKKHVMAQLDQQTSLDKTMKSLHTFMSL